MTIGAINTASQEEDAFGFPLLRNGNTEQQNTLSLQEVNSVQGWEKKRMWTYEFFKYKIKVVSSLFSPLIFHSTVFTSINFQCSVFQGTEDPRLIYILVLSHFDLHPVLSP